MLAERKFFNVYSARTPLFSGLPTCYNLSLGDNMALDGFTPQIKSRPAENQHWHSLASDEVLAALNSMAESGLSEQEAARRLQQHGPNQLEEAPPTTFLQLLWGQFNNFVVILLIVASLISAVLGDY